ncbi:MULTISPECIES: hypothetical protein [Legionella]|uniref:Uncharacterized protein n=1 Tax=Legionella septentrionalis TaxID=2498109 RepID=A0A3S0V539_9GAMM|nr:MULTISPECIES: hypothetical protein [Legionella]MCP0913324.1 hypothetical protein [Legionella sp. 27cVA30]RUQ85176.1 hypothetical protein EKM59_07100 [Legionella septentrionalis]RUQ98002.1 hypothetical protein ELY11_06000 [Legionella septentrionalis]RUR09024.1 hypothetical protein ELY14_09890 [Legionella septentrionalis]RUR14682.1 hypothetical protein ELY10_08055 [Legionella septentrionalis]
MKRIFALVVCSLMLGSSASFAADTVAKTDMNTKWICTTNASSSDVADDKAADDKMANQAGSASDSFAFAAKNCRDCTKITCEVQE